MTYVFSNFARTLSGHFQRVRLVKGGRQAHDRPLHELDHHIHEHDRAGALLSDAHRQLSQRSVAVRVRPVLCAPLGQDCRQSSPTSLPRLTQNTMENSNTSVQVIPPPPRPPRRARTPRRVVCAPLRRAAATRRARVRHEQQRPTRQKLLQEVFKIRATRRLALVVFKCEPDWLQKPRQRASMPLLRIVAATVAHRVLSAMVAELSNKHKTHTIAHLFRLIVATIEIKAGVI